MPHNDSGSVLFLVSGLEICVDGVAESRACRRPARSSTALSIGRMCPISCPIFEPGGGVRENINSCDEIAHQREWARDAAAIRWRLYYRVFE